MRCSILAILAAVSIAVAAAPARADGGFDDAGFGWLLVGLPVLDATIFVGGVAAATGGTANVVDGLLSSGWSAANYAFGGLNVASTLAYVITMAIIPDIWSMLLWPCLAHAGLATANFALGSELRPADADPSPSRQPEGPALGAGHVIGWSMPLLAF